jgi:hypothetical protein
VITPKAILEAARDAVKDNAALLAWCASEYESDLTVFVGLDEGNPPGESDCPFVAFFPDRFGIGQERAEHEHGFGMLFGILNETKSETENVVEYRGVYDLSDFWELLWNALVAEFSEEVALSAADAELEPIDLFPLFLGAVDVTLEVTQTLGAARCI